ncbi:MAG: hypothetical protein HZC36_08240 [Armatimonadetes bacterium]|nr:hypothetical protein [Armatimonadota bacterium]
MLLKTPVSSLKTLAAKLESLPPSGSLTKAVKAAGKIADLDTASVEAMMSVLASLAMLQRRRGCSASEVLSVAAEFLSTAKGLKEWNAQAWKERVPVLSALLSTGSLLSYFAKIHDLYHAHSHLLLRSQILTDVRWVFAENGESLVGGIPTHTLVLEYIGADFESKTIEFTMDASDIGALQRQVARAQRKLRTVAGHLKNSSLTDFTPH